MPKTMHTQQERWEWAEAVRSGRLALAEAAEGAGVTPNTVRYWMRRVVDPALTPRPPAEPVPVRPRRLAKDVLLYVVDQGAGPVLLARDVGRDGSYAPTVRRVAGAGVSEMRGELVCTFSVPPDELAKVARRHRDALSRATATA